MRSRADNRRLGPCACSQDMGRQVSIRNVFSRRTPNSTPPTSRPPWDNCCRPSQTAARISSSTSNGYSMVNWISGVLHDPKMNSAACSVTGVKEKDCRISDHRGGSCILCVRVVRNLVQMVIKRDPSHGYAYQNDSSEQADGQAVPSLRFFHQSRGEPYAAPRRRQHAGKFCVPRQEVHMA